MTTHPLAPGTFSYDTVSIVLDDFGKLGKAYVETDEAEANESWLVNKIIEGGYSNPIRVIAFNTHEGWSRDVTETIAQLILDLNRQGVTLSSTARDFVERVTGQTPIVAA